MKRLLETITTWYLRKSRWNSEKVKLEAKKKLMKFREEEQSEDDILKNIDYPTESS